MKDKLEIMAQVGRLEQDSTKFGQSQFVTATQLKCRVWNASGVKKKTVSEVLRKCGVCVSKMMFLTLPRQGTNFKAHISCAYLRPKIETYVK